MPNTTVYTNNQYYQEIATAIRAKNGQTTSYKPSEMAPAIMALVVGTISLQSKSVTPSTATQTVTADQVYDGLSSVTVAAIQIDSNNTFTTNGTKTPATGKYFSSVIIDVPTGAAITNTNLTVTPAASTITYTIPSGYTGFENVTVNAVPVDTNNTFTTNGTKTPAAGKWFSSVVINVPTGSGTITTTTLSVTPETTIQTFTPPSGYEGFGTVTVEAIPSEYVIPTGTLTITLNGTHNVAQYANVYVNVPTSAGPSVGGMVYTEEADANGGTVMIINAVDLSADTVTPEALVTGYTAHDSTGTAIVGTFSGQAINNQNITITPSTVSQTITASSGYTGLGTVTIEAIAVVAQASPVITVNSSGLISATTTQGTGYVNGGTVTTTSQLATQAGVTITPSETAQTAVTSYRWTTGTVTVAAIPSDYIGSGIATRSSADLTANGATITAPAGYYDSAATKTITNGNTGSPTWTTTKTATYYQTTLSYPNMTAGYFSSLSAVSNNIFTLETKNATPSTATQTITPTSTLHYLEKVTVAAVSIDSSSTLTSNGTHNAASGKFWSSVTVSVPVTVATLTTTTVTYTPSETAQTTTVNTPTGYDGLSKVTVNVGAISNTYVGSGITTRTTLATNANTVTASAGYYPNSISYTVPAMTVPTSTSASNNGGTRKITVTPGTSTQYINLPTGYNNATAYFQINAMTNGSATPAATISATGANVTVGTNVLTFTKSITLTPQVTAGYISAGTAAARTVTLTATITTKAAATYTPSTATQTIAANQYLTGAQTIAPIPSNYKDTSDATAGDGDIIFGETAYASGEKITGTLVINRYYTGANAPASSLGNNGDIYLQA